MADRDIRGAGEGLTQFQLAMAEAQKQRAQIDEKAIQAAKEKKKEMVKIMKQASVLKPERRYPIIRDINKLPDMPQLFVGEAEVDMPMILRRLEAMADDLNTTSKTILRKCGMTQEQASFMKRKTGIQTTKYGQFLLKLVGLENV